MQDPRSTHASFRVQRLILAFAIVVVGCIISVFTYLDFQQVRKTVEDKLSTQSNLVATNLQLHMRSANHVLEEIMALLDIVGHDQQRERMQSLVNAMPIIRAIGILDRDGRNLLGTRGGLQGRDFSNRPYFVSASTNPQRQRLYISTPYRGITGHISIALSKAIFDQQNQFQGVAFAVLDTDHIEMLLGSTLYTADMWAALVHIETGEAVRVGALLPGHSTQQISDAQLRELLPDLVHTGRTTFFHDTAHGNQIVAASLITGYAGNAERPLLVVTGRSHRESMTNWLRLAYFQAGLLLMFAVVAVAGLLLYQRRRRQYEARRTADQREVKAREQDYRVIVEHTTDCVVKLDAYGRCSYVNPAFSALFGRVKPDTPASNFFDVVMPQDLPRARHSLAAALARPAEQRFAIQCMTRQGPCHMEWTICSIEGDEGAISTVIGVGRDVTAHVALRDALRVRAHHDSLTGLINRGYFLEILASEIERKDRYQQPLSIMMVDIDHFKNVNDTWGHQAGDLALQSCARMLEEQCRDFDVVARVGGEEFMVILPGTTSQDAMTVAERMRLAIAQTPVSLPHGQELWLTASVGVATLLDGDTGDTIMQRADTALYAAKQAGRNRVRLAGAEGRS